MSREPRQRPNSEASFRAWAKAKILNRGLRQLAHLEADATAQALFAILLAESWPDERDPQGAWSIRMPMQLLERRLRRSKNTVRAAIETLEHAELLRQVKGSGKRTSRYVIPIYAGDREGQPLTPRGSASDPPEGQPLTPLNSQQQEKLFSRAPQLTSGAPR